MPNENSISRRGLFMKLGILFNGLVATALAGAHRTDLFFPRSREDAQTLTSPGFLSGRVSEFPEGETRLATLSKSLRDADRRQDRGHGLLGAARRRRAVPGVCGQLCAPRLPGSLVSAIRSVHVPMPRRSVLPRRLARFGSAGARACSSIRTKCRTDSSRFRPVSYPHRDPRAPLSIGKKPPCAD